MTTAGHAPALAERLIQAAVDYESGRCSSRELAEARAAVESAIIPDDAQAERVWHRKDCPFCGSPDGQYSASLQDLPAAFFCKGCGINAAQPPAAPVETAKCDGLICEASRHDNVICADDACDYMTGTRSPPQRSSAASEPVAYRWHFRGERAWTLVHSDPGNVEGTVVQPLYLAVPQPVPLTQQDVADVIAWAKEHDLPVPLALFAHFKMSRGSSPLPRPERGVAE